MDGRKEQKRVTTCEKASITRRCNGGLKAGSDVADSRKKREPWTGQSITAAQRQRSGLIRSARWLPPEASTSGTPLVVAAVAGLPEDDSLEQRRGVHSAGEVRTPGEAIETISGAYA
jgi:hypothetical protein